MKFYGLLIFLLLAACGDSDKVGTVSMANKTQLINVEIGEEISNLLSSSPVSFSKECISDVDMCWYKVKKSFGDEDLPSVEVNKSLRLDQVASVSTAVDGEVGTTVENLDLSVRSLPDGSKHDEYRAFLYDLIKDIKKAGWVHYYAPSDPRISGSQIGKINSADEVMGDSVLSHPWLDPNYNLDHERWLKVGKFYNWHFYKDGNHLTLQAWRRDSDAAPDERGTYLVSLSFTTEREYWSAAFTEAEDKKRWKELLPAKMKEYAAIRKSREDKAEKAGIKIDSSYQDPTIKALK